MASYEEKGGRGLERVEVARSRGEGRSLGKEGEEGTDEVSKVSE